MIQSVARNLPSVGRLARTIPHTRSALPKVFCVGLATRTRRSFRQPCWLWPGGVVCTCRAQPPPSASEPVSESPSQSEPTIPPSTPGLSRPSPATVAAPGGDEAGEQWFGLDLPKLVLQILAAPYAKHIPIQMRQGLALLASSTCTLPTPATPAAPPASYRTSAASTSAGTAGSTRAPRKKTKPRSRGVTRCLTICETIRLINQKCLASTNTLVLACSVDWSKPQLDEYIFRVFCWFIFSLTKGMRGCCLTLGAQAAVSPFDPLESARSAPRLHAHAPSAMHDSGADRSSPKLSSSPSEARR